jgi:hypothetical protein
MIQERWRAYFYISGGMCGRNGIGAFFENVQRNEFHVASMTKEDVDLYWTARNNIS